MGTLLEQVDDLRDLVTSHVGEIERERRISEEVVTAIRGTGLNRSLVPATLGGAERPLTEVLEVIERIASFDGSTGWCAAIGAGSNLFSGYVDRSVAERVFSDPDQGNAGVFGPMGDVRANGAGLTLSGRWPFCSNSLHSAYLGVACHWYGDGEEPEPIPRYVMVPIDEHVTIEDTWDALGLCGTGSHHATIDGAPVEREQTITFLDPPWAEGPLFRLPLFCVLGPVLGTTALGMARGAIDDVRQRIEGNVSGLRGTLADDPVGLADFAEADAALRAVRAGLFDASARAWEHAERGEKVPKVLQAQVFMSMNYGCEVAFDVTATAHRLGGGSAAYGDSSLLRRLRDIQTARQHIMFGQSNRPMLAKTLAGEDTFAPPFIV
jgi:alkylation response protein AidB-like acyl-CoA dehydrogenase